METTRVKCLSKQGVLDLNWDSRMFHVWCCLWVIADEAKGITSIGTGTDEPTGRVSTGLGLISQSVT